MIRYLGDSRMDDVGCCLEQLFIEKIRRWWICFVEILNIAPGLSR